MLTFLGTSSKLLNNIVGDEDDIYDEDLNDDNDYDDDYYDDSSHDEIKETNKTPEQNDYNHIEQNKKRSYTTNTDECCICLSDLKEENKFFPSKCNHYMCIPCLDYYFMNELNNERGFLHESILEIVKVEKNRIITRKAYGIKCPIPECNYILKSKELEGYLNEENMRKLFKKAKEEKTFLNAKCNICGLIKDFKTGYCNKECQMRRIINYRVFKSNYPTQTKNKKYYDLDVIDISIFKKVYNKQVINYTIDANVKFCPRCCTPIEKNGGCHNMLCNNCKSSFNWDNATTMDEALRYLRKTNMKRKRLKKLIKG